MLFGFNFFLFYAAVFFLYKTRVLAFIADVCGPGAGCFVLILGLAVGLGRILFCFRDERLTMMG